MDHQALFDSYLSNPAPLTSLSSRKTTRATSKRKRPAKITTEDDMSDDSFSSNSKPSQGGDECKKKRRRDQNRKAAQNSRDKKKKFLSGLQDQVTMLSEQNADLMQKVEMLMEENARLKSEQAKPSRKRQRTTAQAATKQESQQLQQPRKLQQPQEIQQHQVNQYHLAPQPMISPVNHTHVKDEPAVCDVRPVHGGSIRCDATDDGRHSSGHFPGYQVEPSFEQQLHQQPSLGPLPPGFGRSFGPNPAPESSFGQQISALGGFPNLELQNPAPSGWSNYRPHDSRPSPLGLPDFGFGNGFEIELDIPTVPDFAPGSPSFSPMLNSHQESGGSMMNPISLEG
jgi:regulator of replication initiation timing